MSRLQTAEWATFSEQVKMNPSFSTIRRALFLESLCMSMLHTKGTDDLSCPIFQLVDKRMSLSSDIGSSKRIFLRSHRLDWCTRSEYKPSFFLPSRQEESASSHSDILRDQQLTEL